MSLLEDVYLEDEAGEAEQIERVIEGDEFDDRPRSRFSNSDNASEKEDEAEEDKRRVDPDKGKVKRVIKPRFLLNPARLTGPRGIQVIPEHFKDFKFKGKGHEKEDLDLVLKRLEHWAYRLYPKFEFEDCLKKIETLGKKRPVMVHLAKIRSDQFLSEETVVQKDSSDEETLEAPQEEDEFDKLLQQQIELARSTPAPGSVRKTGFSTPMNDRSSITMPKATSSPSISDEQKERMIRNRKLAEERRLERLKTVTSNITTQSNIIDVENVQKPNGSVIMENNEEAIDIDAICSANEAVLRKHNRSNVIDSSDEECEMTTVNTSITVDVHVNKNTANEDVAIPDNDKETLNDFIEQDQVLNAVVIDNHDILISENDGANNKTIENSVINENNKQTNEELSNDVNLTEEIDSNSSISNHAESENDASKITENNSLVPEKSEEITMDGESEVIVEETTDIKSVKSVENKENINMNTAVNDKNEIGEIMDIDFSDDF